MGVGASSSSARVVKLNPDFQPFTQARVVSAGGRVVRASRCASESCSLDESGKIKALGSCKEDINVSEIAKFKDLERLYENTEEHARTLEMVLVSTEGSNLELSQKVSQLEEQLEVARNKAVSWRSYENTIFIKNQHIQRLEMEIKTAKEELLMHQVRSKRKLKKLQMDLAQAKQDGALTIMELKEKIKAMYKAVQAPRVAGHVVLTICYPFTPPHLPGGSSPRRVSVESSVHCAPFLYGSSIPSSLVFVRRKYSKNTQWGFGAYHSGQRKTHFDSGVV
ncbi:coiled-coil domain-containing protein 192 isoform X3 [Lissotriton helveticus]